MAAKGVASEGEPAMQGLKEKAAGKLKPRIVLKEMLEGREVAERGRKSWPEAG